MTKNQILLAVIFILLNAALLAGVAPEASYLHGGDAALYMGPAKALIELGWLASALETPQIPLTFAPPLYSIFLALPVWLFSWTTALAVVVVLQLAMLWFTARAARQLVPDSYSNVRTLAQALILFNPNALITAHLIQTESLFTLLAVLLLVCLKKLLNRPNPGLAFAAGLLLGLAALTRPAGLYAIPVLPFLLPLLALTVLNGKKLMKPVFAAALALSVTAAAVTVPWFMRNQQILGAPVFTTNSGYYLADQYVELLQIGGGYSVREASELRYRKISEAAAAVGIADPDALSILERTAFYRAAVLPLILQEPVQTHLKAFLRSMANLYIGGGASNFKNYLGLQGETLMQFMQSHAWSGFTGTVGAFIAEGHAAYMALVLFTLAWATVLRLLGVAGLISLCRNGEWTTVLMFAGYLGFFTAQYLYLGQSRFRVPLEPVLMILAAIGISAFSQILTAWQTRRRQRE